MSITESIGKRKVTLDRVVVPVPVEACKVATIVFEPDAAAVKMVWIVKLVVNAVGKVTVEVFITAPLLLSSRSLAVQVAEAEPDKVPSL